MPLQKKDKRQLVKTTSKVAAVLSGCFGIRNGFEVVDGSALSQPRRSTSRPTIVGTTPEATALRCLFDQQTSHAPSRRIRMNPASILVLGALKVGDIVEAMQDLCKILVLILSVNTHTLTGAQLVFGAQTLLQDTTNDNEIFLSWRKVTLSPGSVTAKIESNSVVLRFAWDEKKPAFVGLNQWAAELSQKSDTGTIAFHEGDFVMLAPRDGGPLLDIVQVYRIRHLSVYFRRLARQSPQDTEFKHDRLLIPAPVVTRMERSAFKPLALCQVSLLTSRASSWSTEATDFFVTQEHALLLRPECGPCTVAYRKKRCSSCNLTPLNAMELMCGAGGLSLGLDLSGACDTKFAIDAHSDSVKTFRSHHPNTEVYCNDVGDALQRAVAGRKSEDGIDFPRRGEVDVIAAGPPCQGFSRKNQRAPREAAEEDPRNLLVCTVLGWVDHLRPQYLVLENVEGFTAAKLGGHDQGMVKLMMKSLLTLGYGVTCGYVQSGAFGCPQSRGRFVLLAAREDLTLPTLPRPTHHFLGKAGSRFAWRDRHGESHATERPTTSAAMLGAVSISDAIDDLPVFDWQDPHQTYAGPDQIEIERARAGIPQLAVVSGEPVGFPKTSYHCSPRNSFQERMRVLAGQTTRSVTQQQTCDYAAHVVEQVVNVALEPGANYDSWSQPGVGKPDLLDRDKRERWLDKYFKFERLDGSRYFKTLTTTVNAQGSMLHPTQRRLLTVRECARAQGFPDWVEFHTDTNTNLCSAYRQIGNAVAVPLSNAIGRALIAARMRDSQEQEQPASSRQPRIVHTVE